MCSVACGQGDSVSGGEAVLVTRGLGSEVLAFHLKDWSSVGGALPNITADLLSEAPPVEVADANSSPAQSRHYFCEVTVRDGALRRSVGQAELAKSPKKSTKSTGQKEMLMPIDGKKPKEAAARSQRHGVRARRARRKHRFTFRLTWPCHRSRDLRHLRVRQA